MDHRLQALCAARVRWPLITAIQAARVPEPSPLNGPRPATLYRFEKTNPAQQAGAGYDPQVIAWHWPPHATIVYSIAVGRA